MQVLPMCVSLLDVGGPLLFGVEFRILRCVWVRVYVEPQLCLTCLAMWIKCRLHCLLALNPLKGHELFSKPKAMALPPEKKCIRIHLEYKFRGVTNPPPTTKPSKEPRLKIPAWPWQMGLSWL